MSFAQNLAAISIDKRIAIGPCVCNSAGVYGPFCAFNDGEVVSAFAELATTLDNDVLSIPGMADELRANGFDVRVFQTFSDVVGSPGDLKAMFDKAKLAWMNKQEGITGNASYWRWWTDQDTYRLPFGDQSRYGMNATSYYDADLIEIARQSAKSGNFTNSPAADNIVNGPRASAAYMMQSPESIPQSFAQAEIAVRSMVDVNIPPSINVQVSGVLSGSVTNLQGSVTGSGTAGISAHSRGESSPITTLPNGLSRQ